MTKYLIIDDEHIAHDIIKGYCDMLPHFVLQKHCYDAIEAMQYLSKHEVDLIFLDLNMPKLKGFDFLRTVQKPPQVIVTTAYREFALEGYELNVIDYLLKPFSFERFLQAIQKIGSSTKASEGTVSAQLSSPKRLFLRADKKHHQLNTDDILYLEAYGNYTKVMTSNGMIVTREKISAILKILPSEDFLQVHKSFVVATAHIDSIEGNRIFIGSHEVPIGKVFRMNVNRLLG